MAMRALLPVRTVRADVLSACERDSAAAWFSLYMGIEAGARRAAEKYGVQYAVGLDAVLEPTKAAVLKLSKQLDDAGVANKNATLCQACGTGGMLKVAEATLDQLAREHGKEVSIHLFGQEIQPETYTIAKADLLIKGEGQAAENMKYGSTLSSDAFPLREFDFVFCNPPYGKSWKSDLECMGGKKEMREHRFMIEHADGPEYSLVTRSSDGQMLFLADMQSGCPAASRTWSN